MTPLGTGRGPKITRRSSGPTSAGSRYQILITFDLEGADPSAYETLREEFSSALQLETVIHTSVDDGGKEKDLPYNTLAALWHKDDSESKTRDYVEGQLKDILRRNGLTGRYLILVAQNWSVAANAF